MSTPAADDLYAAFAEVPHPSSLHGCPCCVGPAEGRALLRRPLRSLTADDLARYAAKALNTWGGPEEFRFFAPRLLELACDGAFIWPDVEIVFAKLAQAGWRSWPERNAVDAFLRTFWTRTLAAFPARPTADTALCALSGAVTDMTPYLDEWGRLPAEPAVRHLHEFASSGLTWRHGRPRLGNAFWDVSSGPYRQVVAWLTGGPAAAAVSAAFARTDDDAALELLSETWTLLHPQGRTAPGRAGP